jgi:hypothetical protein
MIFGSTRVKCVAPSLGNDGTGSDEWNYCAHNWGSSPETDMASLIWECDNTMSPF